MDAKILAILACPLCDERPPLEQKGDFLVCTVCGSGYRIENGICKLLPEDAIPPEKMREYQS